MQLLRACVILLALLGQPWTKHAAREHERTDMATPIWISSNGDWGDTASWSTGSVPVSADTVVFDGVNSVVSVTSGLNQTGIDLSRLDTSPEYTGDIGLPGNPLRIDASTVLHRGRGSLYFKGDGGGISVQVDSANLVDALVLSGTSSLWTLDVKKGHVTCDNTVVNIGGVRSLSDKSIIIIEKNGAETIAQIMMQAGFCQNFRALSAATGILIVNGGVLVHEDGAVTTLHVQGGVCEWNADETLTIAVAGRGLLDFTRSGNVKTVAGLVIYPGAEVFESGQTNVSATTDFRKEIP
ncbi:hypothetical protein LCGC14_1030440 [marine sediment metagenome]|uniref:Uncharacterized protein n=1 Tax=marine sediment metagenome TaxID=412755 RepID=A0A0F9R0L8_9ZZZZ